MDNLSYAVLQQGNSQNIHGVCESGQDQVCIEHNYSNSAQVISESSLGNNLCKSPEPPHSTIDRS